MSTPIEELLKQIELESKSDKERIAKLDSLLGQVRSALEAETVQPFAGAPDGETHQRLTNIEEALAVLLEARDDRLAKPSVPPPIASNLYAVLFRLFWLAIILFALWACMGKVIRDEGRGTSKPTIPPVTSQEKSIIDGAVQVVTADIEAGAIGSIPDARLGLRSSLPPSMPARNPFVTAVDTEQAAQPEPQDVGLYPISMDNVVRTLVIDDTVKKKRVIQPPPAPPADKQPTEPLPLPRPSTPASLPPTAILPAPPRLIEGTVERGKGQVQNRRTLLKQRLQRFLNR